MKDFFKPEDFLVVFSYQDATTIMRMSKAIATIAQAKLNSEIEKWPVIYKQDINNQGTNHSVWVYPTISEEKTLFPIKPKWVARLAFAEEFKPKVCGHNRLSIIKSHRDTSGPIWFTESDVQGECLDCGKQLKAKWEVDESSRS